MSLRHELKIFAYYYWRITKQVFNGLWAFARAQVIIAILASLLILYLQIRWGLIPSQLTFPAFLSVAYPYLGIVAVAFVFHAIRAPFILDKERQREIDALNEQNSELKEASSERDNLLRQAQELEQSTHTLQSEKSKQDEEITELKSKLDQKARRKYIREHLGKLLTEGQDSWWHSKVNPVEGYKEYKAWLDRAKQFLSQESEVLDSSYLARFEVNPLGALDEFIKELKD